MDSYQNIALLENLYRLKSLGYNYVDSITPNQQTHAKHLPHTIENLNLAIESCFLCDLSKSRRQSMCGYGSNKAKIMFIDAFVSPTEDESSQYYVGRSGTMLKDMIENVLKLQLHDTYLTHTVKCKPFGFQNPSPSECGSCLPYLHKQIDIINPKILVTLGPEAYRITTGDISHFDPLRGAIIPFADRILIPIYHPQYLLRNPSFKKETLLDLQTIKGQLG